MLSRPSVSWWTYTKIESESREGGREGGMDRWRDGGEGREGREGGEGWREGEK